jgi:hypothetical protein
MKEDDPTTGVPPVEPYKPIAVPLADIRRELREQDRARIAANAGRRPQDMVPPPRHEVRLLASSHLDEAIGHVNRSSAALGVVKALHSLFRH